MTSVQTVLAVTILQQGFFAAAWLVLAALGMARRASLTWGIAVLLLTASMAVVLVRAGLPPALGAALPNVMNVVALLLVWRGVRIFVRRPPAPIEQGLVALAGCGVVLLAVALDAPHGVVVIATAGSTAYTLFRAAFDVRSGLRGEFGPLAAALCALPLVAVGAVMVLRLVLVLVSGTLEGHGVDGGGALSTGLVFSFMATSLAMNFAMGALVILRLVNRLRHLSQHDALTQLVNRRGFEQRLEVERARLQRGGRPFALLSLDVDHFKSVNDRHGHAAGDQVLVGVARVLKREARTADVVARMGGEEFAMLLHDSDVAGARQFAQRLLAALRETAHAVDGERLHVTASIGLGVVGDGAETGASVWRRVDAALYRAKAGGRDRVETAP